MLASRSFRTPGLNYIIGLLRMPSSVELGLIAPPPRVLVVTRGVLLHSPVSLPPISFLFGGFGVYRLPCIEWKSVAIR